MPNNRLEAQFITAVLDGRITIDATIKSGLSERHFQIFPDLYFFIREYHRQHGNLPSLDLVTAKSSVFSPTASTDDPMEMLKAIREAKDADLFYTELQRTVKLLQDTGNVLRARNYLEDRLQLFVNQDETDVFELTSGDFTAGREDFEKRRKAFLDHGVYGIPTGFGPEFDEHLNGGWINGNLYGIAGNSGIGKSFVAQVVINAASMFGKTSLYTALEGTLSKEYFRFLTIATGALNNQLQRGNMDTKEFSAYEKQMREMYQKAGGKCYLALHGNRDVYTPEVFRDKIEQVKPHLAIIDYLTLMGDGSKENNWETYLNISKRLKNFATRYDIPIIVVLQGTITSLLNEKMTNADIAQSKGVVRDFDHIVGLSKVQGKENIMRVNTMKMRDSESDFDAFYQTGWNSGRMKFLENVGDMNESF